MEVTRGRNFGMNDLFKSEENKHGPQKKHGPHNSNNPLYEDMSTAHGPGRPGEPHENIIKSSIVRNSIKNNASSNINSLFPVNNNNKTPNNTKKKKFVSAYINSLRNKYLPNRIKKRITQTSEAINKQDITTKNTNKQNIKQKLTKQFKSYFSKKTKKNSQQQTQFLINVYCVQQIAIDILLFNQDCVNCKNLINICKFIADYRFSKLDFETKNTVVFKFIEAMKKQNDSYNLLLEKNMNLELHRDETIQIILKEDEGTFKKLIKKDDVFQYSDFNGKYTSDDKKHNNYYKKLSPKVPKRPQQPLPIPKSKNSNHVYAVPNELKHVIVNKQSNANLPLTNVNVQQLTHTENIYDIPNSEPNYENLNIVEVPIPNPTYENVPNIPYNIQKFAIPKFVKTETNPNLEGSVKSRMNKKLSTQNAKNIFTNKQEPIYMNVPPNPIYMNVPPKPKPRNRETLERLVIFILTRKNETINKIILTKYDYNIICLFLLYNCFICDTKSDKLCSKISKNFNNSKLLSLINSLDCINDAKKLNDLNDLIKTLLTEKDKTNDVNILYISTKKDTSKNNIFNYSKSEEINGDSLDFQTYKKINEDDLNTLFDNKLDLNQYNPEPYTEENLTALFTNN